jgi:Kef-type K+ transport system membrane component KefB
MIDAVAQLGILLLLLLTGMETGLAVIRRSRGAAFSVSFAGIIVPFLCGALLQPVCSTLTRARRNFLGALDGRASLNFRVLYQLIKA